MTTLELIHQLDDATRHYIFLIHKPRTKTEILINNTRSTISSLNIPDFSPDSIVEGSVKASVSAARNLDLSEYVLINKGFNFRIKDKPRNLLLETALTSRSVTFLPSHILSKYSSIQSSRNTIKMYSVYTAKVRDIQDYLTFEKLAKNSHLLPAFNNDLWRQLNLIKRILQLENTKNVSS